MDAQTSHHLFDRIPDAREIRVRLDEIYREAEALRKLLRFAEVLKKKNDMGGGKRRV